MMAVVITRTVNSVSVRVKPASYFGMKMSRVRSRSDHKAEPGAKRPGPRWRALSGRLRRICLFLAFYADPVAPLRFAPDLAFFDPHRCAQSMLWKVPTVLISSCRIVARIENIHSFRLPNLGRSKTSHFPRDSMARSRLPNAMPRGMTVALQTFKVHSESIHGCKYIGGKDGLR